MGMHLWYIVSLTRRYLSTKHTKVFNALEQVQSVGGIKYRKGIYRRLFLAE